MKAIEISEFGAPDVLKLAERPMPEPKAGEVLIKVAASGINRPDVLQRKGAYAPPPGASDLLGLEELFKEETPAENAQSGSSMSDAEIDRIADRVIQRLSTQIIENIAWDVVPDITEKIVREELKKNES